MEQIVAVMIVLLMILIQILVGETAVVMMEL